MLHRKIILSFLALLFIVAEGYSQVSAIDSVPRPVTSSGNMNPSALPLHKLHVGVQLGSQFMTTSGYGSGLSTYVSPTLTYPVSKKFILRGGLSVINTSMYGVKPFYSTVEQASYSGNFTQAMLWVSGQYQLNNHLTITGTAYKTFDIMNYKPGNSPYYLNNPQGAYLNIGYRINDYLHIDATFGYSKGNNPYGPYNSCDPFDRSPFGYGNGYGMFGR
ncbi:MAG: hypothetical protein NTU98_00520 [Bacteroidetes bacterium]|nr:hypothetical protein [Bacteroidota bacterium]